MEKKYLVQVAGVPSPELLDKLRQGVRLAEGEVQAKRVSIRSQHKQSAVLEMILDEGKNREIRRMLARLGHKVHQLKRVGVGGLSLGNLLPGQWRQLAWSEVESLRREALAAVGPDGLRTPRADASRDGGRPPRGGGPGRGRPSTGRPSTGKPSTGKPSEGRPETGASRPGRPIIRRKKPGKASNWRAKRPAGGEAR